MWKKFWQSDAPRVLTCPGAKIHELQTIPGQDAQFAAAPARVLHDGVPAPVHDAAQARGPAARRSHHFDVTPREFRKCLPSARSLTEKSCQLPSSPYLLPA